MELTSDNLLDALCAETDPEIFFPDKGQPSRKAMAICDKCPISLSCLETALAVPAVDDWGVWGGTTARQRVEMRRNPNLLDNVRDTLSRKDAENRVALEVTIIR